MNPSRERFGASIGYPLKIKGRGPCVIETVYLGPSENRIGRCHWLRDEYGRQVAIYANGIAEASGQSDRLMLLRV